jgi:hypothetical protein
VDRKAGARIDPRIHGAVQFTADAVFGRKERHESANARFEQQVDGRRTILRKTCVIGDQADILPRQRGKFLFPEDVDSIQDTRGRLAAAHRDGWEKSEQDKE